MLQDGRPAPLSTRRNAQDPSATGVNIVSSSGREWRSSISPGSSVAGPAKGFQITRSPLFGERRARHRRGLSRGRRAIRSARLIAPASASGSSGRGENRGQFHVDPWTAWTVSAPARRCSPTPWIPVVQVVDHVDQDQLATHFAPLMAALGRYLDAPGIVMGSTGLGRSRPLSCSLTRVGACGCRSRLRRSDTPRADPTAPF